MTGPDEARISFEDLAALLQRVFINAGVSESNAHILAWNCAMCERDGSVSHGVFRVPGYLSSLRSGWVDGHAVPVVERVGPVFLRVDARNGFSQPALSAARPSLIQSVRDAGAAVLAIRDSHHFSALWPDVEPLAREGLIAMTFVGGHPCVIPPGGNKPIFGTNPMAFAAPVAGSHPLVFDQATSAISNGDLKIAARDGHKIPSGCGVDRARQPTVDPSAVLDHGALLPFGGHKGGSIALMIEILAAALTGGPFSSDVVFPNHSGAETPKTGQLLIAIDPERGGTATFGTRVGQLIERLREAGQKRVPGDRRYALRKAAEQSGIPISLENLNLLQRLS